MWHRAPDGVARGASDHGHLSGRVAAEHRVIRRASGRGRPGHRAGTGRPRSSSTTTRPFHRWFPDGELNTCYNALDRHVDAGRGDQAALIYDSPVTGRRRLTYREARATGRVFAGVLSRPRCGEGDRVVIYMPMVPEAVSPCWRAHGSARSTPSCSAGFAPTSSRCGSTTRSRGRGLGVVRDRAGHACRVQAAARRGDRAWRRTAGALRGPAAAAGSSATAGRRPRRRLGRRDGRRGTGGLRAGRGDATRSTSSTRRARPDGPRASCATTAATPSRCVEHAHIYDVDPGEVFWAASDIGWVVGHSYIVYAPLLAGCDDRAVRGQAGRHARRRRVLAGGRRAPRRRRCSPRRPPSARSSARTPTATLLGALRPVVAAHAVPGRRAARPRHLRWAGEHLGVPVVDHWWQTETGWPIVAPTRVGLGDDPG